MARKVLIVDDEADVGRLLAYNLGSAGFETVTATSGEEALSTAVAQEPSVVVLDLMLPDVSGFEVCRRLRETPRLEDVGVLMLTARGDEYDRIVGLEMGADDYVVKPFSVREVVLRVQSLAKRVAERRDARSAAPSDKVLRWHDLEVNVVTHDVRVAGQEISLRPLELKLLITLLSEPGRVFTRDELLTEVWGVRGEISPRTVDVHVKRLRGRLGACAEAIETVHGFGYRARRD
jgi:two-component system phosphate regulon response regulator PhoB